MGDLSSFAECSTCHRLVSLSCEDCDPTDWEHEYNKLKSENVKLIEALKKFIVYGHHESCIAGNIFSKPEDEAKDCTCHILHVKHFLNGSKK